MFDKVEQVLLEGESVCMTWTHIDKLILECTKQEMRGVG